MKELKSSKRKAPAVAVNTVQFSRTKTKVINYETTLEQLLQSKQPLIIKSSLVQIRDYEPIDMQVLYKSLELLLDTNYQKEALETIQWFIKGTTLKLFPARDRMNLVLMNCLTHLSSKIQGIGFQLILFLQKHFPELVAIELNYYLHLPKTLEWMRGLYWFYKKTSKIDKVLEPVNWQHVTLTQGLKNTQKPQEKLVPNDQVIKLLQDLWIEEAQQLITKLRIEKEEEVEMAYLILEIYCMNPNLDFIKKHILPVFPFDRAQTTQQIKLKLIHMNILLCQFVPQEGYLISLFTHGPLTPSLITLISSCQLSDKLLEKICRFQIAAPSKALAKAAFYLLIKKSPSQEWKTTLVQQVISIKSVDSVFCHEIIDYLKRQDIPCDDLFQHIELDLLDLCFSHLHVSLPYLVTRARVDLELVLERVASHMRHGHFPIVEFLVTLLLDPLVKDASDRIVIIRQLFDTSAVKLAIEKRDSGHALLKCF